MKFRPNDRIFATSCAHPASRCDFDRHRRVMTGRVDHPTETSILPSHAPVHRPCLCHVYTISTHSGLRMKIRHKGLRALHEHDDGCRLLPSSVERIREILTALEMRPHTSETWTCRATGSTRCVAKAAATGA